MKSILSRILGSESVSFGNTLAHDVAKRYPLSIDGKGKISSDRLSRILEKAYFQAQQYQREQIGRASCRERVS
jgi:hypothetical protein